MLYRYVFLTNLTYLADYKLNFYSLYSIIGFREVFPYGACFKLCKNRENVFYRSPVTASTSAWWTRPGKNKTEDWRTSSNQVRGQSTEKLNSLRSKKTRYKNTKEIIRGHPPNKSDV